MMSDLFLVSLLLGLATVFLLYLLRLAATLLTGLIGRFFTPSPNICDRTEQVQQAILEQLPGVNSFKKVTTAHLESVTALDLSGQSITELQATDFKGLSNLSELNLYNNQLPRIFSGLSNQDNHNQLTTLPEGIFSGLSNLSSIPQPTDHAARGYLSRLSNSRTVSQNQLTTLPQGIFSGLSNLSAVSRR